MLVNKETVAKLKQKILSSQERQDGLQELREILEAKNAQLWRADYGSCCGSLSNYQTLLNREIGILSTALEALETGDFKKADTQLNDYISVIETEFTACYPDFSKTGSSKPGI